MADLVKLRRGIGVVGGRRLWAVEVGPAGLTAPEDVAPPQVSSESKRSQVDFRALRSIQHRQPVVTGYKKNGTRPWSALCAKNIPMVRVQGASSLRKRIAGMPADTLRSCGLRITMQSAASLSTVSAFERPLREFGC